MSMSTVIDMQYAEGLQIMIEGRLGIAKPHLPPAQAARLLHAAFEALAFLGPGVGDLEPLIANQERLLARDTISRGGSDRAASVLSSPAFAELLAGEGN